MQYTKTALTAVLGRSIRPKNVSIPMNCAVKKSITRVFPFVDLGIWRSQQKRVKAVYRLVLSVCEMPLTGDVNNTVFGLQEPGLEGN